MLGVAVLQTGPTDLQRRTPSHIFALSRSTTVSRRLLAGPSATFERVSCVLDVSAPGTRCLFLQKGKNECKERVVGVPELEGVLDMCVEGREAYEATQGLGCYNIY
jgi:hypothetical protein